MVELPAPAAVTVKVAVVAPEATVTLPGTVATLVLLLDRPTVAPAEGAAADTVTVACEVPPGATLVGVTEIADIETVVDVEAVAVGPAGVELLEPPH